MKLKTILFSVALVPIAVFAQTGSGGWGADAQINQLYDPGTVITFNGKVYGKVATEPTGPNDVGGPGGDVRSLIRTLVRVGLQTPLPPGLKGAHPFLVDGLERLG